MSVETPDIPPICGAVKLVPIAFTRIPAQLGITRVAMTCVREFGHPERDADPSLHLCGTFAWSVGQDDVLDIARAAAEGDR